MIKKIAFFSSIIAFIVVACLKQMPLSDIVISDVIVTPAKFNATISWKTDVCSSSVLSVNQKDYYSTGKNHSINIFDLTEKTEYKFLIRTSVCEDEKKYHGTSLFEGSFVTDDKETISIINIVESEKDCNSLKISWRTDNYSNCILYYGETQSYGNSVNAFSPDNLIHSAIIDGLTANSVYHYTIIVHPLFIGFGFNQTIDRQFTTNSIENIGIANIAISDITGISAKISWITDVISNCSIDYGTSTSYGTNVIANTSDNINHSAELTGLSANTIYHLRINANATVECKQNFQTPDNMFATSGGIPVIISNITENGKTSSSINISWDTNFISNCNIEYGKTVSYGNTKNATTGNGLNHVVSLTDLIPNTVYHYKINANPVETGYSSSSTDDKIFTTNKLQVFCAIAASTSTCVISPDGNTWTLRNLPQIADWKDIAWNGSVFCTVANNSNIAATSLDGITWIQRTLPGTLNWTSIAWNGSVFCTVAYNSMFVATSPDGITWTLRNMGFSGNWTSICAGNGNFIVVASSSGICLRSTNNGVSWSSINMPSSGNWIKVHWNGSSFFSAKYATTNAATSPDGITWTSRALIDSYNWWVLGGYSPVLLIIPNGNNLYDYSGNNGSSWSTKGAPAILQYWDMTWSGAIYCIVAHNTNKVLISPDGITWTQKTLPGIATWEAVEWSK